MDYVSDIWKYKKKLLNCAFSDKSSWDWDVFLSCLWFSFNEVTNNSEAVVITFQPESYYISFLSEMADKGVALCSEAVVNHYGVTFSCLGNFNIYGMIMHQHLKSVKSGFKSIAS